MTLVSLNHQLTELIASMYSEGLLDEQFRLIEVLQKADNPNFVVQIIVTFLDGTDRFLNHVDQLLNEDVVDFSRLTTTVHNLRGSCLMFGAQNMSFAAIPLVEFCDANDKDECRKALDTFKSEYLRMRNKLETLVQGVFGNFFRELQMISSDEPEFIAEILPMACEDTKKHLNHLENLLNEDPVDYREVDKFAIQMKESVLNTGAIAVPADAELLRFYCRNNNKEGCIRALTKAKQNFNYLQEKLEIIVQIQKQIVKCISEEKKK